MLKVTKTKKGYTIRLSEFPSKEELVILNNLNSFTHYHISKERGYKRLLVTMGYKPLPLTMECPINQYFKD